MSWFDYYDLLVKYDGDLTKATQCEMRFAAKCNPNDPPRARQIAESEWKRLHPHIVSQGLSGVARMGREEGKDT